MSQKDADREFIEALTNFSEEIVRPDKLVPMIIDVSENVLEDEGFMDDPMKERTLADKDIAAVAFIVTNLVVQKFGKAICSMVEDGVLVPSASKAAELAAKIRENDEDEDDDKDEDETGGLGDWLKLG